MSWRLLSLRSARGMRVRMPLVLVLSLVLPSCAAAEKAAAKDPQRCERDPRCAAKQGKSRDCITACVDNIDCMERCQQIQRQTSP